VFHVRAPLSRLHGDVEIIPNGRKRHADTSAAVAVIISCCCPWVELNNTHCLRLLLDVSVPGRAGDRGSRVPRNTGSFRHGRDGVLVAPPVSLKPSTASQLSDWTQFARQALVPLGFLMASVGIAFGLLQYSADGRNTA